MTLATSALSQEKTKWTEESPWEQRLACPKCHATWRRLIGCELTLSKMFTQLWIWMMDDIRHWKSLIHWHFCKDGIVSSRWKWYYYLTPYTIALCILNRLVIPTIHRAFFSRLNVVVIFVQGSPSSHLFLFWSREHTFKFFFSRRLRLIDLGTILVQVHPFTGLFVDEFSPFLVLRD